MNFYLRRISRGDIAYRANVPEHLWELILRDGITTNDNYDRDSIGEFDLSLIHIFTKVSVEKFLRADVNATKVVDHTDAVAIVNQFK